jgi:hypothetical protein
VATKIVQAGSGSLLFDRGITFLALWFMCALASSTGCVAGTHRSPFDSLDERLSNSVRGEPVEP